MEIWKQCVQAPDYIVSNQGQVAREKAARGAQAFKVLAQYLPPDERPTVSLRVDGKTKTFRVCNLVLEAFGGPAPSPKYECCHNDGQSTNNAASNLRWDTRKGNFADMVAHGTRRSGEKHHMAKLTEGQVADIRSRCRAGELQRVVAADYGIYQSQVSRIVRGVRWGG